MSDPRMGETPGTPATFQGQTIHFGLALDGERGWHPKSALGESRLGPLGFLSLLESQLGILHPRVSSVERVAQMADCLARAANGRRFYERSLKVDEIGTASTLLRWRDAWIEAGWTGNAPDPATGRIADMAAVEAHARTIVAPGMGERLAEVAATLAHRDPRITVVHLHDDLAEHSALWRRVLACLPLEHRRDIEPQGPKGSMLRTLQQALLDSTGGGKAQELPWKDDGTVRVVRGETSIASAAWLAAQFGAGHPDLLLVMEQQAGIADVTFAAADHPLQGVTPASRARPALQVLPLALRLLWAPLDFAALLAFLTLPQGPLPAYARRRLAEQVAASPGIGSEGWKQQIEKILEKRESADEKATLRADIAYWLESERFDPRQGAPIAVVLDRVARVADWHRSRAQSLDESRAAAAQDGLAQSMALAGALRVFQAQGKAQVTAAELDRLSSRAAATGTRNPDRTAQAGSHSVIADPAAALEPFDDVLWWRLSAIPMPRSDSWSASEVQQLSDTGAQLLPPATRLAAQARGWLAPILQARKRLTLVLPRAGDEAHPLWVQVHKLVKDIPVRDVETVLVSKPTPEERTIPIAYRPRPALRRWWHLPPEAKIPWPERSSFSALELFLFDPARWLLQYPARIQPSSLLELPGDFTLLGSLAHRVVEVIYGTDGALERTEAQVGQWFDDNVDRIVAEEGAILLEPGRRADLESFRQNLRRAVVDLHARLLKSGARRVWPERELKADTALGPLMGYIDLHVEQAAGLTSVVDMKWAGSRYGDMIVKRRHIQLATYGKLVHAATGRWPGVAYYILSRQELHTLDDDVFAGETKAQTSGVTSQLWQQVEDAYRWRRAQVEMGEIEVVREEIAPEPDADSPPGGLAIEPLRQQYNRHRFLDGWRDGE